MTAYVLGVLAFAAILLIIALSRSSHPRVQPLTAPGLAPEPFLHRARSVLKALGYSVESEETHASVRDWTLLDPRPLVGGRVIARLYLSSEPIDASDVQAALDAIQGASYQKAMLFSAGGFTPAAKAVALDSRAELVDPQRLGALSSYLSGSRVTAGALETLVRPSAP